MTPTVYHTRSSIGIELVRAIAQAEKVAPGIVAAGKGLAGSAKDAQNIYEQLAVEIRAYKRLNKKTMAVNRAVRDIAGLKLADTGYVEMRLDAQHIVEATWHTRNSRPNSRESSGGRSAMTWMRSLSIRPGIYAAGKGSRPNSIWWA